MFPWSTSSLPSPSPYPRLLVVALAFATFVSTPLALSAQAEDDSESQGFVYRLDAGDIINIYVYQEEALSQEIEIGESGNITYPLLGNVGVRGLTLAELEREITSRFIDEEYLINPDITINIVEYRPFYIDGEVEEPGAYPFEPGLTLRMAVSLAGGFTERGSRTRIAIRASGEDDPSTPNDGNILGTSIRPGDVITVSQRIF